MIKIIFYTLFLVSLAVTQSSSEVLHESNVNNRNLKVVETPEGIHVSQNGSLQSIHLKQGWEFGAYYYDYFHGFLLFDFSPVHFFEIGFGSGTNAKSFLKKYNNIKYTGVEIDPEMVRIANKFFNIESNRRLSILVGDGRQLLSKQKGKFDVMLVDAYAPYDGASLIPKSVASQEFFKLAHEKLNDEGLVLMNIVSSNAYMARRLFESIANTAGDVFKQVYFLQTKGVNQKILIAAKGRIAKPYKDIVKSAEIKSETHVMAVPNLDVLLQSFRPYEATEAKVILDKTYFKGDVLRFREENEQE